MTALSVHSQAHILHGASPDLPRAAKLQTSI